ncbi:MAG: hypothetical protein V2L15_01795, partial [Desulfobacteraceae bacterium]|nr:hypothetical protein [Desulfobacteraceae bacterium]
MADAHESDRQAQFEELKKLYLQGVLSEATFRAAITGLGMDPAEVLPPSPQQVVEHQTQIGE